MIPAVTAKLADEELAARATREACQVLYDRHAPALLPFLAARAPAECEDLHQDVWLRVWSRLPGGFRGGSFRAWLFEIARNLLIDRARRKRPERLAEDADRADPRGDACPVSAALERERQQVLEGCLQKLEKQDAVTAALVRGRLGGEGYEQLCPRLGLTNNGAYKRWHEAVKQLQACVERASS
jgi:RNA polymerase sigma-70 factor (ECF subfamily)